MPKIKQIYTRGGDQGETDLGDGTRVAKNHPRILLLGTIDELNAWMGFVASLTEDHQAFLQSIQNDLMRMSSAVCVPKSADEKSRPCIGEKRVLALENLHRITHTTLYFRPEQENAVRRAPGIKKWVARLRKGDIRWQE